MGLQVIDVVGAEACCGIDLPQQLCLHFRIGYGETGLMAISIDCRGRHHGEDRVAICHGLVIILEHEDAPSLGADIAVTRGIEGMATPARRQHGRLGKSDERERVQVQADAARQCHCGFA
ncbi:MAG: hypothetical protein JW395_1339 [Nitrospira sp.]|nr:hypothetical protein [Nitrospira sp.]